MGLTGKYDFPGISKLGAIGLKAAFASSPYTAWLLKLGPVSTFFIELLANFLANKGLLILNLGAIYLNGEIDQRAFDNAMDEAFKKLQKPGLTPQQKKDIDDEVIAAARRFIVITKHR